jgi:hypothetical protein
MGTKEAAKILKNHRCEKDLLEYFTMHYIVYEMLKKTVLAGLLLQT